MDIDNLCARVNEYPEGFCCLKPCLKLFIRNKTALCVNIGTIDLNSTHRLIALSSGLTLQKEYEIMGEKEFTTSQGQTFFGYVVYNDGGKPQVYHKKRFITIENRIPCAQT
jgi:hypothetical protein